MISYEDYRNGNFYNSYNKYTIVSVVPSSCCIYREPNNQLAQCKMKSVNIYRKGCYDILMFWMESFCTLIAALTLCAGAIYWLLMLVAVRISLQVREWRRRAARAEKRSLVKHKMNAYHHTRQQKNERGVPYTLPIGDICMDDTSTLNETLSYIETRS